MIMYSKIFNWTKTFLGKALAILTAAVAVMTFIDFLLKWQIYSYLFSVITAFFGVLHELAFEVFVSGSLVALTLFLWKLQRQFIASKPNALEKQILDTRTQLESQIKKNSDATGVQIKAIETRLNNKLFELERTLVDFEIENHRNKNQVGEVSMMIKKLGMDNKSGYGAEDTLLEIKEYIKKSGMPNYFLEDLNKALKGIPEGLGIVRDEILKIAQERLYNPRK